MGRKKIIFSLVGNILTALAALIGAVWHAARAGLAVFLFYTFDSNILIMGSSFLYAWYLALILRGKRKSMPRAVLLCKYFATCLITVTFLVVLFVLAPMYRTYPEGLYQMFLRQFLIFHHLLSPLFALITFLFFDEKLPKNARLPLTALLPTVIYAVAMVILNIAKVMYGPYPFLYVYAQPVYVSILWFFVIMAFAYLIAFVLYAMQRAMKVPASRLRTAMRYG